MKTCTIATRGSKLALWQAEFIKACLEEKYPGIAVELMLIKTKGDIILDVPLAKVGGKGLFVKEIEEALLQNQADIAVHSMKDVPMQLPEGLELGCIPQREIPNDMLLSAKYENLDALPQNAHVGTSSLRRQAQLLALRPDLRISSLRGNVDTRLRKLMEGQYDAIVLASAGIKRLGLEAPHMFPLDVHYCLPAVGQGSLGIECRSDRKDVLEALQFLEDKNTRICVSAERAFLAGLDGGCQVPIAGHAVLNDDGTFTLKGLVAHVDGSTLLIEQITAAADSVENAKNAGTALAQRLLQDGAAEILQALYNPT